MTEYLMPTGMPSVHTFGTVLSKAYEDRLACDSVGLDLSLEHALTRGHDSARCSNCQAVEQLRPRREELVLCAICRCCSVLAEETDDGADFCSGGCEPPSTAHAPIASPVTGT